MKNNASLIYNAFLVIGDFLALVLAFLGAFFIRSRFNSAPVAHPIHIVTYIDIFILLLPFWIIVFALLGLYNSNIYEKRFSEVGRLLIGSFIGMLFVVFWNFLSLNPIFPAKLVPIYGFILGFIFLVLFRNLARLVRTILFSYELGLTHVLIIGNTPMTDELVSSLMDNRTSGYRVMGVVGRHKLVEKFPKLTTFSSFPEAIKNLNVESVHGIIQTELYSDESRNREILDYAQSQHKSYRFVPGNSELFVGNLDVELFRSSVPVIAVHQTALFGWGRIAKRVFDLVFGGLCLLIALPFMIIVGLAIKAIRPKGHIIYKQARLTRFNTKIYVYKFQTLRPAYNGLTPEEAFEKMERPDLIKKFRDNGDQLPNDPRIDPLGNFLRRSSLDELPQLFNVVKGDLSLVGPRALVPYELEQFEKKNLILSVKSGLTGLAQVTGRKDLSFEERRKLDLYYVQNWNFWLDLTILIKTLRILITRSGAI